MIVEEKELDGKGTDQILFHVFIFNIQGIRPPGVIKNYYTRMKRKYKRSNRDYAETMGIAFMTITDLSKKKLWPFVIKKLINNQYFWEDVAFLRNENFKCINYNTMTKNKRLLSAATPWGSFKCSSGAIGRVELVPRQRTFQIHLPTAMFRDTYQNLRVTDILVLTRRAKEIGDDGPLVTTTSQRMYICND